MGVNKLKILSSIFLGENNNKYMSDISEKYDNLKLHIMDINLLGEELIKREKREYIKENGMIVLSNKVHEIRLISGIEATLNCFYSIT